MKRRLRGFTLIEMMVTVAIIAIIAAIAIPSYSRYVTRAHRSEGQALLNEAAARMERYYAQNNKYTASPADLGLGNPTVVSDNGYYELDIASYDRSKNEEKENYAKHGPYLLTAKAAGPQKNDKECQNLTLNAQGKKGTSGTSSTTECWR